MGSYRRGGAPRQINTCRKVPVQVNFLQMTTFCFVVYTVSQSMPFLFQHRCGLLYRVCKFFLALIIFIDYFSMLQSFVFVSSSLLCVNTVFSYAFLIHIDWQYSGQQFTSDEPMGSTVKPAVQQATRKMNPRSNRQQEK